MERDFLGILGRDSGNGADASRCEAALPSMKWPFSNMVSTTHQFRLPKSPQEEKPRKHVFNNPSSSRFHHLSLMDAFEVNQKTPHGLAAQAYYNCLGFDKQGFSQYPLSAYQPSKAESFAALHHQLNELPTFPVFLDHGFPGTDSRPFSDVQFGHKTPNVRVAYPKQQFLGDQIGPGNFVGHPGSWHTPWPTKMTAQLTIFYAGHVNVYDDVSLDKVQEIISFASQGSNMNSNIMDQTAHAPIPTTSMAPTKMAGSIDSRTRKRQAIAPMPMLLNQGISPSVSSHSVASSVGGFRMNSNAADSKAAFQLVPANQQGAAMTSPAVFSLETAETNIPTAVPQARKASLTRFLEKRKERLTNAMPYSCSKITPESGNVSSLSSLTDINLSGSGKDSWVTADQKSSIESEESLSTK